MTPEQEQTRSAAPKRQHILKAILSLSVLSLLPGCSMMQTQADQARGATLNPAVAATTAETDEATAPIPKDTLYSLMVAEFAGHRHQYDVAMDLYLQQAARTGDAGIAERALRIAQYTGNNPGVAEASTIWLAADPDDPAAVQSAAQVALAQQDYDTSLRYYTRFYELTGIGQFDFFAATAATTKGADMAAVLQSLETVAVQYPQESNLWYARAIAEQALEQNAAAIRHIDEALRYNPDLLTAAIQKGRILAADGQLENAISWLGKLRRQHPDNKQIGLLYARLQLQAGKLSRARDVFADLYDTYPEDNQILLSLALLEEELSEREEAAQHFQELLERNQHQNEAHYYLGRIAEDNNDPWLALDHYQQVMNSREFLPAQLAAARVINSTEGTDEAVSYLQRQAQIYPEHASQLTRVQTDLLLSSGQTDKALQYLTDALSRHPDDENLLYTRSMVADRAGDKAMMEQDLRRILQSNPDNAEALNALGYSLTLTEGRLNEAEPLIVRAIELQPDNAAIIDSLGWLYFRQGRINDAGPLLLDAWNRMKDHEVAAHLGEWYWVTGERKEARKIWKEGLRLEPESEIILETLQRFELQPDAL